MSCMALHLKNRRAGNGQQQMAAHGVYSCTAACTTHQAGMGLAAADPCALCIRAAMGSVSSLEVRWLMLLICSEAECPVQVMPLVSCT